jgi:hypothetical protein
VKVSDLAGCEFEHDGQGTLRVKAPEDAVSAPALPEAGIASVGISTAGTAREGESSESDSYDLAHKVMKGRKLVGDKIVDPTVLLFHKSLQGEKPSTMRSLGRKSVGHKDEVEVGASVCPYPKAG